MTKHILTAALVGLIGISSIQAQAESALLGRWEITYDDFEGKSLYEFRKEQEGIVGYSVQFTDEDGKVYDDNTLIVTKLVFDGEQGEASYKVQYDEEDFFTTDLSIKEKSDGHLNVSYSYWGFSSTETWKKVNKGSKTD